MPGTSQLSTPNVDLESQQTLATPAATYGNEDRRPSGASSQAVSQTTSSKSSKSLGRWEEYKPGNFTPQCPHGSNPNKCTQCGSSGKQKKLFWVASVVCCVGLIGMFIAVGIIEGDRGNKS